MLSSEDVFLHKKILETIKNNMKVHKYILTLLEKESIILINKNICDIIKQQLNEL